MCRLRAIRASNGEPSSVLGGGQPAPVKEYVRTIDGLKATVVSMKDKHKEEATRLKSNVRRLQDSLDSGKRVWAERAEEVRGGTRHPRPNPSHERKYRYKTPPS